MKKKFHSTEQEPKTIISQLIINNDEFNDGMNSDISEDGMMSNELIQRC